MYDQIDKILVAGNVSYTGAEIRQHLLDEGFAVVPRVPTDKMKCAPYRLRASADDYLHTELYRAMVDEFIHPRLLEPNEN